MLKLDRVSKTYRIGMFGGGALAAVRDASFEVGAGQIVSLIGESGSGKTTIGRMILRLTPVTRGAITFEGHDIASESRRTYFRHVQGIFQDPFSSYNPIFKADHVFAMLRPAYFAELSGSEWAGRVEASLQAVGLAPEQVLHKYPHQLSGGQLQRLLIARALLLDIRMLVADEIISMLDASTRIDVLNLLGDLKTRGLGILFITHDLSLGYYSSERTVILSKGVIVEMGATEKVYRNPLHPYTQSLLAAVPQLHAKWDRVAPDGRMTGAAGRCIYHAMRGGDATAGGPAGRTGRPDGIPTGLVEAEPDHLVGCFRPYQEGAC
jgi:ABC-type oligopeptide transport system ATPase subunit